MNKKTWRLVEHSEHENQSATLMAQPRTHGQIYALKINNVFDQYYYDTNQAFNALERWEVSVGKLPSNYRPEEI